MPDSAQGWKVAAALFLVLMASSGLGFYSLPIFVRVMSEEGAFSVHTISTASAIFFATSGITGLVVARALARMDVRWVVTAGGLLGALCLLALGRVEDRTALFSVYALFGVGFSATSLIPAMTVVARWFEKQRAIAVGVVSTGLSCGGVVVAPIAASLAERHGLPAVTPWLACAYLLGTLPLTWAFVRDGPNGRLHGAAGTKVSPPGVSYSAAVRGPFFFWFSLAYVFLMGAQVGAMMHVYNLASLRIDPSFGRLVVALIAISSICGRFGGGFLLTRVSVYPMASVLCLAQAVTLAALSVGETPLAIGIATIGFGLAVGNLLMMQPLIVIDAFGMRDYPKIYALTQLVTTFGYAVGPEVMGRMFDGRGDYRGAFSVAAAAALVGFVCFWIAVSRRPTGVRAEPLTGGRLGS